MILAVCAWSYNASAQMTDQAIIDYAKTASAQGKSHTEMAKELMARGATMAQIQDITARLNAEKAQKSTPAASADSRMRRPVGNDASTPAVGQTAPKDYMLYDQDGNPVILRTVETPSNNTTVVPIYGHDMFRTAALNFEPNENQATPANYKLGPGDEIIIDIWGANEAAIRQTISPDGKIIVSQVGPIYLNGLTVSQAENRIKRALSQIYSGVDGDNPVSDISVSLGQNRTIQVSVMGEVNAPGTYRLSGFSTVFNALYRAGGVTGIGSLRAVRIVRGGEIVGESDIYEYIFYGKEGGNIKLQDGDVINVPAYGNLVEVTGNVKRPMRYEMKAGETVSSLVTYAGGFSGDAYTEDLSVVRQTGSEKQVFTVKEGEYSSFSLADGDVVNISHSMERFSNKVEVKGSVFRPGIFEFGGEIATVRQLVEHAGGPTEDAFLVRAVLLREKEDLSFETVPVDLANVLSGKAADILLKKNDVLTISNKHEIDKIGSLTILGYVNAPGEYVYSEGTTVEDLILMAGGLMLGASLENVNVARRTNDNRATSKGDTYAETFDLDILDGYVIGGDEFVLQPYDVVTVRRSPGYREQKIVSVSGEVNFEGEYALVNGAERLSDLIKRAGGVSNFAYLKGGRLTRKMNEEEKAVRDASIEAMKNGSVTDSTNIDRDLYASTYTVGIQLDKAIASPGSDYDVTLREGDVLFVPEYVSTVNVHGDVMYPNTVSFIAGKPVSYYIQQGGGYGIRAKRSKTYLVYMNGTIALAKRGAKVEPGCEIIVPEKPEREKLPAQAYTSFGSSLTSMAAMVVALIKSF